MEVYKNISRLNSLAVPRFLLCISLIIVFAFNNIYDFFPKEYFHEMQRLDKFWFKYVNFFYQFHYDNLENARWIAIIILFVTALGFFPAITCWLHTWIAYSFIGSSILVEGGDQMNAIISFFLIPFCINHGLNNFWLKKDFKSNFSLKYIASLSHYSIQIQLAACYFLAGFSKYNVGEWRDGEAMYYWFNNNVFGANENAMAFINTNFFSNEYFLYFCTISVLIIEFFLGVAIFISDHLARKYIFLLGLLLHFGIWLFLGLGGFSLVMIAGLIIYLLTEPPILIFSKNKKLTS